MTDLVGASTCLSNQPPSPPPTRQPLTSTQVSKPDVTEASPVSPEQKQCDHCLESVKHLSLPDENISPEVYARVRLLQLACDDVDGKALVSDDDDDSDGTDGIDTGMDDVNGVGRHYEYFCNGMWSSFSCPLPSYTMPMTVDDADGGGDDVVFDNTWYTPPIPSRIDMLGQSDVGPVPLCGSASILGDTDKDIWADVMDNMANAGDVVMDELGTEKERDGGGGGLWTSIGRLAVGRNEVNERNNQSDDYVEDKVEEKEEEEDVDINDDDRSCLNIDLSWLDEDDDEEFGRKRLEHIVGKHVEILSPGTDEWRGAVVASEMCDGRYLVIYLDGDVEQVRLGTRIWRRIS